MLCILTSDWVLYMLFAGQNQLTLKQLYVLLSHKMYDVMQKYESIEGVMIYTTKLIFCCVAYNTFTFYDFS